jgi:uncharacterized membrane protein
MTSFIVLALLGIIVILIILLTQLQSMNKSLKESNAVIIDNYYRLSSELKFVYERQNEEFSRLSGSVLNLTLRLNELPTPTYSSPDQNLSSKPPPDASLDPNAIASERASFSEKAPLPEPHGALSEDIPPPQTSLEDNMPPVPTPGEVSPPAFSSFPSGSEAVILKDAEEPSLKIKDTHKDPAASPSPHISMDQGPPTLKELQKEETIPSLPPPSKGSDGIVPEETQRVREDVRAPSPPSIDTLSPQEREGDPGLAPPPPPSAPPSPASPNWDFSMYPHGASWRAKGPSDTGPRKWDYRAKSSKEASSIGEDKASRESWIGQIVKGAYGWLVKEGNIWVSLGILFFLVGFTLLFKFAYDKGFVSIKMSLSLCALAGCAMWTFGFIKRHKKRNFALVMQGGGIGLLYLVTLAASKLFAVLPFSVAGIIMIILSVLTVILSVRQNFQPLALAAILAGYATPIFLSVGSGNYLPLFVIYSILNFEVLVLSFFKDWSLVRRSGLLASAAVGMTWGLMRWEDSYFSSVDPFIVLFFLNYLLLTMVPIFRVKFKILEKEAFKEAHAKPDIVIMIALPFVFLILQFCACSSLRYGPAISSAGLGLVYLFLGLLFKRSEKATNLGYKPYFFLFLAFSFLNLSIPLFFQKTSAPAIWALEGSFLIFYAFYYEKGPLLRRLTSIGIYLQVAACVLYFLGPSLKLPGGWNLAESANLLDFESPISPLALTGFLFAVASFLSVFVLENMAKTQLSLSNIRGRAMKPILFTPYFSAWVFSVYGSLWFFITSLHIGLPIRREPFFLSAFFLLAAGGAAALVVMIWQTTKGAKSSPKEKAEEVSSPSSSPSPYPSLSPYHSPFLILFILPVLDGLLFALVIGLQKLFLITTVWLNFPILNDISQPIAVNLIAFLLLSALAIVYFGRIKPGNLLKTVWALLLISFTIFAGFSLQEKALSLEVRVFLFFLPVAALSLLFNIDKIVDFLRQRPYLKASFVTLLILLFIHIPTFLVFAFLKAPSIGSFEYYPIVSPIDGFHILFILSLWLTFLAPGSASLKRLSGRYLVPLFAFLFLNSLALKIAFKYFNEHVYFSELTDYPYFNGCLAFLWGFVALILMVVGKRLKWRSHWLIGAALLALDIVKLFTVDLRNSETIVRIAAFLLIGVLLFIIGWLAPLPPKERAETLEKEEAEAHS